MDNSNANFQTSFIPKKPLAEERVAAPRHTSIFSFLATLIFFGSLASAGVIYFYQANLLKTNAEKSAEITAAQNSFQPSLIQTLERLDHRITDAKTLLNGHVVVSPIFEALQTDTLKSVQFTKFSYTAPSDPTAPITVQMSGRAQDYASIALESDQLAKNVNIHNSIFSNLALDQTTGMVTFDLVFTVDADLVRFTSHLDDLAPQVSTPVTAPAAGAVPGSPSAPVLPTGSGSSSTQASVPAPAQSATQ